MFDNPLLPDVFPENYIKTTILLYLSSCEVETAPMTTRVVELSLCMTKIYSIKLAMRWKSDIALYSSTVTLFAIQFKNKCVSSVISSHSQSNNLLFVGNAHTIYGN